jgi:excisionase family DNA binding protein
VTVDLAGSVQSWKNNVEVCDSWLSVKDVSEIVLLPERTVRDFVRRGVLRAYKFGTSQHLRIRKSDVEATFRIVQPKTANEH